MGWVLVINSREPKSFQENLQHHKVCGIQCTALLLSTKLEKWWQKKPEQPLVNDKKRWSCTLASYIFDCIYIWTFLLYQKSIYVIIVAITIFLEKITNLEDFGSIFDTWRAALSALTPQRHHRYSPNSVKKKTEKIKNYAA